MKREPVVFIIDLDDTLTNTTRDLKGSRKRIKRLTLVRGARKFLKKYQRRVEIILLSAGEDAWQQKKIELVGIRNYLSHIMIVPSPKEKESAIRSLVYSLSVTRSNVFVIGDRLDIEVLAGNMLGCTTVRMILPEGKYAEQVPSVEGEIPKCVVGDFKELDELFSKVFRTILC